MRFAVQQLLGRAAALDLATHALQRACEEIPVGLGERRRFVPVRDQPLSLCDSLHEVWRRDLDASHPGVQAMERVRVGGRRDLLRCHRLVVGPPGHREAVAFVDARLDPGLERRDRAPTCGKTLSKLDLERGDLLPRPVLFARRHHRAEDVEQACSNC